MIVVTAEQLDLSSLTFETESRVAILVRILSVMPILALSAGTKLGFLDILTLFSEKYILTFLYVLSILSRQPDAQ